MLDKNVKHTLTVLQKLGLNLNTSQEYHVVVGHPVTTNPHRCTEGLHHLAVEDSHHLTQCQPPFPVLLLELPIDPKQQLVLLILRHIGQQLGYTLQQKQKLILGSGYNFLK